MKIVVSYIFGENYEELAEIAIPSLEKFCRKHSYHTNLRRVQPNEKGTYAFIRTENTRNLLNDYDVVLQLEGDMLITNTNYKIEDWLEEGKDFYCCKDINGVNTGSWIAKSTDWMKEVLEFIYTNCRHLWDEQAYWEHVEDNDRIKYLPHPSINSIVYDMYAPTYGKVFGDTTSVIKPTHEEGDWQEGDFLLHAPGMTLEMRLKLFNEYKNKIIL